MNLRQLYSDTRNEYAYMILQKHISGKLFDILHS